MKNVLNQPKIIDYCKNLDSGENNFIGKIERILKREILLES